MTTEQKSITWQQESWHKKKKKKKHNYSNNYVLVVVATANMSAFHYVANSAVMMQWEKIHTTPT